MTPLWLALFCMALALAALLALPLFRIRSAVAGGGTGVSMRYARLASAAFAGLAPAAAVALYLDLGTPDFDAKARQAPPADFAAIAALPPEQQGAAVEAMVARLTARLREAPDDTQGWRMLARSNAVLGRADAAAAAFDGLFKATEGTAADWRGYLETLIALGPQNQENRDIGAAADKLHALSPGDPLALYFLADRAGATGDFKAASGYWRVLLAATPADAPIRGEIEANLKASEKAAGRSAARPR